MNDDIRAPDIGYWVVITEIEVILKDGGIEKIIAPLVSKMGGKTPEEIREEIFNQTLSDAIWNLVPNNQNLANAEEYKWRELDSVIVSTEEEIGDWCKSKLDEYPEMVRSWNMTVPDGDTP